MYDLIMVASLFIGGIIQDGPTMQTIETAQSELQCGNLATGAALVLTDVLTEAGAVVNTKQLPNIDGGVAVLGTWEEADSVVEVILYCSVAI